MLIANIPYISVIVVDFPSNYPMLAAVRVKILFIVPEGNTCPLALHCLQQGRGVSAECCRTFPQDEHLPRLNPVTCGCLQDVVLCSSGLISWLTGTVCVSVLQR